MIFKKKKFERKVLIQKDVLDSILSYCQMKHPNEGILILKGKSKNGEIKMVCRGICTRYKAKWGANQPRYASGQKRCNVCNIFLDWNGF